MGNEDWRNSSIKIVLILFCVCILILSFSFLNHDKITGKELVDNSDIPIGKTVFAGDVVLSEDEIISVPLISHMNYLPQQIFDLNLRGIIISLSTGTVPLDLKSVSSGGISSTGHATGFEGPGYLTLEGENLVVKPPSNFVWGYSSPYKVLSKTEEGVDVYEGENKVESISENDIKNHEFPNNETKKVVNWYNYDSEVGSNFTLEKGLYNFSDNRSDMSPDEIKKYFGEEVYNYTENYPSSNSVVVYMTNYTENDSQIFTSYLGSFPQYGDEGRAHNANEFCKGWNNTIIAPESYGSGKEETGFASLSDHDAPGGMAAHGSCPPARALRDASLNEGFDLPTGLKMDSEAVMFEYRPCEDVKVLNNHDYPIKIVMWTEGSGAGTVIHSKIVKYEPN
ncbi:MAG: hypothetical protein KO202_01600 [Methanobacteriaceae archaeon]|jgi:hypothetical protein|nr:hypothetical protein [Methanobacteriaceae archaeon]